MQSQSGREQILISPIHHFLKKLFRVIFRCKISSLVIFLPRTFVQSNSHSQNHGRFSVDTQSTVFTAGMQISTSLRYQPNSRFQIVQDKTGGIRTFCRRNLQTAQRSIAIPEVIHNGNITKTCEQIEVPISTEEIRFPSQ